MARFVRIVLPVFVVAVVALVWLLRNGDPARSGGPERVEPPPAREVRPEEEPAPEPDPTENDARVVPPIPSEGLVPADDPVEKGPGSLILHVVDRETGEKVRTAVQLWRLYAPGNERWTAGDQLQERREAPHGDARFDELPPGAYQVLVETERSEAPGDHRVDVGAGVAEETVAVDVARRWPVRLKVWYPDGRRAEAGRGGWWNTFWEPVEPSWTGRAVRTRREGVPAIEPGTITPEVRAVLGLGAYNDLVDSGEGFLLGRADEDTKTHRWMHEFIVDVAGQVRVGIHVRGDLEGPVLYGAPTVAYPPVHEAVRMPDGTPALEGGASIHASIRARELRGPDDRVERRLCEVSLQVRHPGGFKPVDLRFPADSPIPRVTLEPAK